MNKLQIYSSSLLFTYREEVKRSMYWLIKRLIKVGARVSYHARRWCISPQPFPWRTITERY